MAQPITIAQPTILAATRGDEAACREIVLTLHRPVLATIFRFMGPAWRAELEDIAQDVFLKVFRALAQFDPARAKFTTWVYSLLRNHCYDVLKKKRLVASNLDAVHEIATDQREGQPAQGTLNRELGERIQQALGTLSEDQRMTFVLREYEQLDLQSIAEITGVSEGTVKSRLFRAKEALRAQLQPYLEVTSP